MIMFFKTLVALLFALFAAVSAASAESINLATEADVVLEGRYWSGGWPGGDVPRDADRRAATLVDGKRFARGSRWDQGTVWWDARTSGAAENHVVLRWERPVEIDSLRIQGDDNDAYLVEFRSGSRWETAWQIPNHDRYGWGLQSFPDPNEADRRHVLPVPVVTTAIRISGDPALGDDWFALSEVQVFGRALE
jgi:hypothetical protein